MEKEMKIKRTIEDTKWEKSLQEAGLKKLVQEKLPNAPMNKSQYIFLESGNDKAGLRHMWIQHGNEFKNLDKTLTEENLAEYLDKEITNNSVYYYKTDKGITVLYGQGKDDEKMLLITYGNNGFVVTAHPFLNENNRAINKGFTAWD